MTFNENNTVAEAVEMIRFLSNNRVPLLYAYIVDDEYKLKGELVMRDLLISHDETLLKDLMTTDVHSINVHRNKDEVAKEAIDKKYLAVPIVDDHNRFIGCLKYKDIIQYAQQQSGQNLQKLFGAGAEETTLSGVRYKIAKRLPWLKINLLTAFLAGAVIGAFEDIIAQITVLAIFLPIISGQGGNTGAQSLAVVMRGLAMDEIKPGIARKLIVKETLAGIINGLAVGLVTAAAGWWWGQNAFLGLIIGIAMFANMILAAFFGAAIPLSMKKMGLDPAQSSNIILTTFTDVCGFLILLTLAVTFRSYLI